MSLRALAKQSSVLSVFQATGLLQQRRSIVESKDMNILNNPLINFPIGFDTEWAAMSLRALAKQSSVFSVFQATGLLHFVRNDEV